MTETPAPYTTFRPTGPTVTIEPPATDLEFFAVALDVRRGHLAPVPAAERCTRICAERIAAAQAGMVGDEEETVATLAAELDVLHAARCWAQAYRATRGDQSEESAMLLTRRDGLLLAATDALEAQKEID